MREVSLFISIPSNKWKRKVKLEYNHFVSPNESIDPGNYLWLLIPQKEKQTDTI